MKRTFGLSLVLLAACASDGEAPAMSSDPDAGPPGSALTYHRDARSILEQKCVHCHEPGNIGPFALTSYAGAFAVRGAIKAAVESGSMPPWQPAKGCNDYQGDFSLSDTERATLLGWIDQGATEGDSADYPGSEEVADTFVPDLTLSMAEAYEPRSSPDDYRCFLIEWPETADKFITRFRVKPGQLQMVHHVLAYIATPDQVSDFRALDEAEEGPGYTCFGSPGQGGGKRPYQVGSWVPGAAGLPFPAGTGIKVDPGSLMVVQMHYNTLSSEPLADQSQVEIALADTVERPAMTFLATKPAWLAPGGMMIPAGDESVVHTADIDVTQLFPFLGGERIGLGPGDPFVIHGLGFHMHQLGETGRTSIVRTGGDEECLLDIPSWDFHWQGSYRLKNETRVEPGDLIRIACSWDNSARNQIFVDGEQLAPRDVQWGEGTTDEMCLSGMFVTAQ